MWVRRLAVMAALLLLAGQCQAKDFVFKGRVVDKSGRPVAGIRVHAVVEWCDEMMHYVYKGNVTTDKNGGYSIKVSHGLSADELYLCAYDKGRYLGWTAISFMDLAAGPKATSRTYDILARKLVPHQVFVVDQNLKPIGGAKVGLGYCEQPNSTSFIPGVLAEFAKLEQATTDGDGRCVLGQYPEGATARVRATKPGYAMAHPFARQVVTFQPAGSVTGRVVNSDGVGVPNATLIAEPYSVTRTGADGRYRFNDLPPGECEIRLWGHPNLVAPQLRSTCVQVAQTTQAQDIIAVSGVVLSGRVIDEKTKKPVPDVSVMVTRGANWAGRDAVVITDAGGRFQARVAPGKVTLSACSWVPIYWDAGRSDMTCTVGPEGARDVKLVMHRARPTVGKVVDARGRPIAGAWVVLQDNDWSAVKTDESGRFSCQDFRHFGSLEDDVRQGLTFVQVEQRERHLGYVGYVSRDALLKGSVVITAQPAKRVAVLVKDKRGNPVPAAKVRLLLKHGAWRWWRDEKRPRSLTDSSGKALIDVYEGGTYTFLADATGYYHDPRPTYGNSQKGPEVVVKGENPPGSVEIHVERANRVQRGRVVDPLGRPVEGVLLYADDCGQTAVSDANGMFTMENLPDMDVYISDLRNAQISTKYTAFVTICTDR